VNTHFLLSSAMYPTHFIFFMQAQMLLSAVRTFSFRTSHPPLVITPYKNV